MSKRNLKIISGNTGSSYKIIKKVFLSINHRNFIFLQTFFFEKILYILANWYKNRVKIFYSINLFGHIIEYSRMLSNLDFSIIQISSTNKTPSHTCVILRYKIENQTKHSSSVNCLRRCYFDPNPLQMVLIRWRICIQNLMIWCNAYLKLHYSSVYTS